MSASDDPAYHSHVSASWLRIERGVPTREVVIQSVVSSMPSDCSDHSLVAALREVLALAEASLDPQPPA